MVLSSAITKQSPSVHLSFAKTWKYIPYRQVVCDITRKPFSDSIHTASTKTITRVRILSRLKRFWFCIQNKFHFPPFVYIYSHQWSTLMIVLQGWVTTTKAKLFDDDDDDDDDHDDDDDDDNRAVGKASSWHLFPTDVSYRHVVFWQSHRMVVRCERPNMQRISWVDTDQEHRVRKSAHLRVNHCICQTTTCYVVFIFIATTFHSEIAGIARTVLVCDDVFLLVRPCNSSTQTCLHHRAGDCDRFAAR